MKKEIYAAVAGVLRDCGYPAVGFSVDRADGDLRGDYACNAAMVAAKGAKGIGEKPRDVAGKLAERLAGAVDGVERVAVAGPGFLNFFLSREFFCEKMRSIDGLGERWGCGDWEAGREVIVEYSSPNLFKPLHVGNLVGTIVGESVARLFCMGGAEVRRVTYPCDVGMTVAKAVWGLMRTGGSPEDIDALAEAYRFGNERHENDSDAKREIEGVNAVIYGGDGADAETVLSLYRRGRDFSFEHVTELCAALGSSFDTVIFESEAGPVGKRLVEEHMRDGMFEEDDGAVIFRGERLGLHTRVFLNSRGLPTYEAKELGNFALKQEKYPGWDRSVIVTGSEQKEYFAVLIAVMRELSGGEAATGGGSVGDGGDGKSIEHIATGFLTLAGGGKMSSRKGNVLTGESLLAELREEAVSHAKGSRADDVSSLAGDIAVGALKYQILRQKTGSDIVFDRERAFSFEGDSGPYLQYTRARILSVLEKAAAAGVSVSFDSAPDAVYAVERLVCQFEEAVALALAQRSPHVLISYATELAGAFNSFYGAERIADAGDPFAGYKAGVSRVVGLTLERVLWVLGIPAPERM